MSTDTLLELAGLPNIVGVEDYDGSLVRSSTCCAGARMASRS